MTGDESYKYFTEVYTINIQSYKDEFLSEADSRCKFIDKLFIDCLDWNEQGIKRETSASEEGKVFYLDYIFHSNIPIVVVEAKKKDIAFELPLDGKRKYKLNGVISKSKNLKDAISQVQKYASLKSIKYAIITNGTQLIAFIANRNDGVPWEEGTCIIFRSLQDIKENYIEFYNLFNRTNFIAHSLDKVLLKEYSEPSGRRIIDSLSNPDETLFRNVFSDAMNKVIESFFSNIIELEDTEILENCYCLNNETKIYEKDLESLLKDNLPTFLPDAKTIILKSYKGKEEIEDDIASYVHGSTTTIPILLIGGLGVGKSTFLRWFFNVKLNKDVGDRIFPVFIDFLKGPTDESKYIEYAEEIILSSLESDKKYKLTEWNILKSIYRDLVLKEEKGLLQPIANTDKAQFEIKISEKINEWRSNKDTHIGRLIHYLAKHHGIKVVLVFDNADQKNMIFQTKVYEYVNMLTLRHKCLAIISLREESFWQASRVGIFDAYHTHIYHLRTPRFKDLLEKRLDYALNKLKIEKGEYFTSFGAFRVKISDLQAFLEMVISSILVHAKGAEILKFLECLACGNMRIALGMFKSFLTSGHTKIDIYISNFLATGSQYTIPLHEFAASVMMQDLRYYSESRNNIIINLFALAKGINSSHFTRLRLLSILSENKSKSSPVGKGYYKIDDIFNDFNKLNYDKSYLEEHILSLLRQNLIETDNNVRTSISDASYLKITACGEYYLTNLCLTFMYLDIIITDIPIRSEEHYNKIELIYKNEIAKERTTNKRLINRRLEAVELLLDYLSLSEWQELENIKGVKDNKISYSFMDKIREAFNKEKNRIIEKINRA